MRWRAPCWTPRARGSRYNRRHARRRRAREGSRQRQAAPGAGVGRRRARRAGRRDARGRTDRARRGATRSGLGGDARAGGQRTGARTRRRATRRGRQPRAHRGGGARASGGRASGRARVRHDSRRRAVRDRRRDPASRAGRRAGSARVRALAFRAGDQRRGPGPARRDAAHVRRAVVRQSSGRRSRARPRAACRFAARPRARRRRAGRSGRAARGAGRDGQRATRRDVAVQRPRAAGRRAAGVVTVRYEVIGVAGIGEVRPGDDVAALVLAAAARQSTPLAPGDLAVISQKIVSKAEGRLLKLTDVTASTVAVAMAAGLGRDARLVEVILRESRRVVRMDRGVLVTETHHGWVCANAGVDQSNVDADTVALLPSDPDGSAQKIREAIRALTGIEVAIIIADTFGRPWREGLTNVAIGLAGFSPLKSYLGERDSAGRPLQATVLAVADELAAAAEPVMGKLDRIPAAIVRGAPLTPSEEGSKPLLRDPARDLFR